jgi:hypothetical protein
MKNGQNKGVVTSYVMFLNSIEISVWGDFWA